MPRTTSRLGRALCASLLTAGLGGCFAYTDEIVIDTATRGDVPWLAGTFEGGNDQTVTITHEAEGVYRFQGPVEPTERDDRVRLGVLTGDCAVDTRGEMPNGACKWTAEQLCENGATRLGEGEECLTIMRALRAPAPAKGLSPRQAERVESLRWIGEGLPWRDDITFVAAPLTISMLGDNWAAAQVRHVASFGPYSAVGKLEPQLNTGEWLLLERNPEGGFYAWSTGYCVGADYDESPALPAETALATMTDCADRLATGALERDKQYRMEFEPPSGG